MLRSIHFSPLVPLPLVSDSSNEEEGQKNNTNIPKPTYSATDLINSLGKVVLDQDTTKLGEKSISKKGNEDVIKDVNAAVKSMRTEKPSNISTLEQMIMAAKRALEKQIRDLATKKRRSLTQRSVDIMISYLIRSGVEDIDSSFIFLDGYIRGMEESRISQIDEINQLFQKLATHAETLKNDITSQSKITSDLLGLSSRLSGSDLAHMYVKSASTKIPAMIARKRENPLIDEDKKRKKANVSKSDSTDSEDKVYEESDGVEVSSDGESLKEMKTNSNSDEETRDVEEISEGSGSTQGKKDYESEIENDEEGKSLKKDKGKGVLVYEEKREPVMENSKKLLAASISAAIHSEKKASSEQHKKATKIEDWDFRTFFEVLGASEHQLKMLLGVANLKNAEKSVCLETFKSFHEKDWLHVKKYPGERIKFRIKVLQSLREKKKIKSEKKKDKTG